MCGVCGVLNLNEREVSLTLLKKMTDSISHRGPDGEGWYQNKSVGFGHRRLAIVDLSTQGQQPMVTQDGRFAITYNGEIYNFLEIRVILESKGHFLHSKTDSEVVLHAWAEWGTECVKRFNGMFAFAIWDSKEEKLFLVRDRYGIKPLYYALLGNAVVFGSEQRAICEHPSIKSNIDKRALLEYFTFQNIFTDRTFIEEIKILPAGTILSVNLKNKEIKKHQYWDYHFREPVKQHDVREYREELERLLRQAVKRQLVSDVEIGSYLSGGMDSGTLTALASSELSFIKTFTCGFDLSSAAGVELNFDERVRAEAMSALFQTEHYEMVLKSGDMERSLDAVVKAIEEPRVGQSYPNYYVARLASKFVKVVLSGTGGDELFGGYPWRYYIGSNSKSFEEYIDSYYKYWHRLVNNTQIKQLFKPIWDEVDDVWTRDIFREVFSNHANELATPQDYVNHSLYFEAKTFLHGLFVVEDKLSMANGIETRVPFMDNDLVDFAMTCPVDLKVKNLINRPRVNENHIGNKKEFYFQQTSDGKSILRDVMSEIIPLSITQGQKKGFSSPDASWFKNESQTFVSRRLLDRKNEIYKFLDFNSVSGLVKEHLEGLENRRLLIWSLLTLDSIMSNKREKNP